MSDEIIGFVVERISDLVTQEVNLLRSARNEFLNLHREFEMMQSFLIDADAKLEAGDHRLRTIVKQIREMAYEAEDLIDSFLQKDVDREEKAKVSFLKRIISFCSCLVHTHQMGNEVEELKNRIRETTERLQTYQVRTNVEMIRRERPKSYPHSIGDENVVGFDNDVEILAKELINLDDKIMAIVGMGGSGKTTMARKIYNHTKICLHFKCRAWVSVSQIWDQESILKEILRQTTGQIGENLRVEAIVQEIHKLLQGKSYLVVFDDVWEQEVLRKVMVPTATLHGSKFLITTRNTEVIRFSDLGYYVHEPRRLTLNESWDLFRKIAFGRQTYAIMEPFVLLGEEMLKKCDGLPLAVVALAGLLSTKSSIHEWERVKNNVSSKIIGEKVGPCEYGRVEDMLALSYLDLSHTLKSCFMYLGLFAEDENIPTQELKQCWIAEGFFKSVKFEGNESIEDVAENHLDELIQRCLVQTIRLFSGYKFVTYIRVHDLIRDLALKIGKEMYFLDTIPSSSSTIGQASTASGTTLLQTRRLAVFTRNLKEAVEGEQLKNESRRLRSFICCFPSPWSEMSLNNLFTNYPLLRVLILNFSSIIRMPDVIGNLIHLRHLQISYYDCTFHLPNSIQNLRNLLCVDIKFYDGPFPNIKHMKQLRNLRIKSEYVEESLNVQDLRNLKVLWDIKAGPWMLKELKLLSPTVEKLCILDIQNHEQLKMIYECPSIVQDRLHSLMLSFYKLGFEVGKIQHCNKLEKLELVGVIQAKSVPLAFPPYLLNLVLTFSRIEDQHSFVAALVRLPYLKALNLNEDAYVGNQLNFPENSMLHLQELTLQSLKELEEIHIKEGAMPLLKSVFIECCASLKVLPQCTKQIGYDKR